jgi:hypothetical protein
VNRCSQVCFAGFLRQLVLVADSVMPVKGVVTFGPTKGHGRREVPLPRFLIDDLAQHVTVRLPTILIHWRARGSDAFSMLPRSGA